MMFSSEHRIFIAFFLFGLLNNILYVVILSAAIDLVGSLTPKAIVLLADVLPSFLVKLTAPFFIHLIPYHFRVWSLVGMSTLGMLVVSLAPFISWKIGGIILASVSSGLGELTFLQLTHYYKETTSISGFSSGTGGAGLAGSFIFMVLTNLLGLKVQTTLLLFSVVPFAFLFGYYVLLPLPIIGEYAQIGDEELTLHLADPDGNPDGNLEVVLATANSEVYATSEDLTLKLKAHILHTISEMKPLLVPYMIPLCSVYISEYVINQGISPTLLFPLDDLPHWLFLSYRDIYVVYGFLYQLGVFISRSSIHYIRLKNLYWLSILQFINVIITIIQSTSFTFPFSNIWLLLVLIFYEGLLGGFLYVNTFMSVSEEVPKLKREFSMGCVGISDSFGVVVAGCLNWWLEGKLCEYQVGKGRDWCRTG